MMRGSGGGASTRSGTGRVPVPTNQMQIGGSSSSGSSNNLEFSRKNDGSNGALPNLTEAQLDHLTDLFSKLEDYDSTHGISILKQAMGYTLTPW